MRTPLVLLLLVTAAPGAAPPAATDDAHDLILLHPGRPYRVRYHLRVGGQSFKTGWNRQVARLFAFLDADGDGTLSKAESSRAPGGEQWRQMSGGSAAIDPEGAPEFEALSRGGTHVTLADMRAYYAATAGGPVQVVWSWLPPPDPLAEELWRRLDADRDGRLSRAELLAARKATAGLDSDDDDAISPEELLGRPVSIARSLNFPGPPSGLARGGLPLLSLAPGGPSAEARRLLLGHYGQGRAREVEAWLDRPPDLALEVALDGELGPARKVVGPADGLCFQAAMGRESLTVGDWVVRLARPSPAAHPGPGPTEAALAAFRNLDADSSGYLDVREVHRPPFGAVAWMRLADRDRDGRLTLREFTDFWELKESVRAQVATVHVECQGRSLFRALDQDGDGRLGVRELARASDYLGPLQRGGYLDRESVPMIYRVTLGLGSLRPGQNSAPSLGPVPLRGPVWFRKMDRNGDGDVSQKEWLGTREQFEKLDIDGDGLLGLEEALRADRHPTR